MEPKTNEYKGSKMTIKQQQLPNLKPVVLQKKGSCTVPAPDTIFLSKQDTQQEVQDYEGP